MLSYLTLNCKIIFLVSNFRLVLNAVYILLGSSPASEFYMPWSPCGPLAYPACFCTLTSPYPVTTFRAVFEPNLFPYKYPQHFLHLVTLHTYLPMKMEQSVPKRRHIKFRLNGITQNNAYNKILFHRTRFQLKHLEGLFFSLI